jgi:hypothetical protein
VPVSRLVPLWRRCGAPLFSLSLGLAASDGGRCVSGNDPVTPRRPRWGGVASGAPLPSLAGGLAVSLPRLGGEAVACALPGRVGRGLAAAVACGDGDALAAGEAFSAGELVAAGEVAPAGDAPPTGERAAPAPLVAPEETPVVVVPETPTPAPALTP